MTSLALLVIDEQIGAFDGKLLPPIYRANQLLSQTMKLIEAQKRERTRGLHSALR